MSNAVADVKAQYVKDKNVHHLFELLASRTLDSRPDDIFKYLHAQLDNIEQVEKTKNTHDPSQIFGSKASQNAVAAPGGAEKKKGPLKVALAVFGLDNAGKTALIAAMGGAPDANTKPTIGFSPVMFETDDFDLCIFDLGGGANFRGIWPHYYHDCHGIIYVVDSSDEKRLPESAEVFKSVVSHEYLQGKPVLTFANKNDLPSASSVDVVAGKAGLDLANVLTSAAPSKILSCCAVAEGDSSVEAGVEWILTTISDNYENLTKTVKAHTAEVNAAKKKRLAEQAKRVEDERAARAAAAGEN